MIGKTSPSRKIFNIFNYSLLSLFAILCAYPIWYIAVQSVSLGAQAGTVLLIPRSVSFENYRQVFALEGVEKALLVSVLRTIIGTGLTLLCSMLLGYLLSKKKLPGRKVMYRMLVVTMYVSGGLIPMYLTLKSYGMLNTFWVYVLPAAVNAFYVILIKTYIEQLPESVEESAMIDGAGTLLIFWKIIIPMSLPIVATIAVYASVAQWNAWFDNHIYTFSNKNLTTIQYLLYNYLNETETISNQMQQGAIEVDLAKMITPRGIRMTMTMISIIPVMCFYPMLQKYFVKGVNLGAVKG